MLPVFSLLRQYSQSVLFQPAIQVSSHDGRGAKVENNEFFRSMHFLHVEEKLREKAWHCKLVIQISTCKVEPERKNCCALLKDG